MRAGPRAHDVVFILIAVAGVLGVAFGRPRDSWGESIFEVLVATAGVVVLWWRRSFPLFVTVFGIAVLLLTGNPLTALIGLLTLAIRRRDRVTVLAAAGLALASTARAIIDEGTDVWWSNGLASIFLAGFCAPPAPTSAPGATW